MSKSSPTPPPLLTVRSAVILLLGVVCGFIIGALTYLAGGNTAASVLAGLGASGSSVMFLHKAIG